MRSEERRVGKSKIEEKYRKMYKKESIRYEICMVYSLLI